ncbi:MAG: LacI family DNA-binding transcriptional regulator [Lachnospiraceae bacterium]|nr:LacI family DNA-binding transcriptional regulator [Lachnospiraceae bacterium]
MKMSIKTISEITGFSPATVSNALNNKKGVGRETSERILAVAKEHGYFPEPKIDNIKLVIYKWDGIIVSDTPFFSAIIGGIEDEARKAGYETTLCNLSPRNADFHDVRNQLLNDPNSALLLLATEMDEEDAKPFMNTISPLVMIDNWFEDTIFDAILIDNTDMSCNAVKYLIAKGHKEIGYLKGSIRIKNFFYREEGYKRALATAGIELNPAYSFSLTPTMEGAYVDMQMLLTQGKPLPTAFFADNDIIALGAMRALQEKGFRIPDDISVVGFDDMPFCAVSNPPLTTVRVHKEEMGRIAVRKLFDKMKHNPGARTKIQVCSTFIERDSVAAIE